MKIELAKSYGFCFGVKRAIKIAERTGDGVGGVATTGELIHNKAEIERLNNNFGVKTLQNISEITDEKRAIIRTHGITKSDLAELKAKDIEIIDATCPFVTKPQQIVQKMSLEGYDIVIFGDIAHPEVRGVMSYAQKAVFVVASVEELNKIKLRGKVAVVSQTTKKIEDFSQIVAVLLARIKEVRVFNTICNATLENQEATRELAARSDLMIIIGGKHSSNTKQLYLIAKSLCADSHHIESASELQPSWFEGKNLCGIGAGASTPQWIIEDIVKKIKQISTF